MITITKQDRNLSVFFAILLAVGCIATAICIPILGRMPEIGEFTLPGLASLEGGGALVLCGRAISLTCAEKLYSSPIVAQMLSNSQLCCQKFLQSSTIACTKFVTSGA